MKIFNFFSKANKITQANAIEQAKKVVSDATAKISKIREMQEQRVAKAQKDTEFAKKVYENNLEHEENEKLMLDDMNKYCNILGK